MKKRIFSLVLAVVLMMGVMFTFAGCGDKGEDKKKSDNYMTPIGKYFEAIEKGSAKKMLEIFPECMKEEMEKTITESNMERALSSFESLYGENIKVSYKEIEKDEIDEDDLKDVEDDLKDEYDDDDIEVKKGYKVKVEATIKGDDDEKTATNTLKVYQINGKWCMISQ